MLQIQPSARGAHAPFDGEASLIAALKEAIRKGIVVLSAISDADARYRSGGSAWMASDDPWFASMTHEAKVRQYSPKEVSQAQIVAGWLSWVGELEGEASARRIWKWGAGCPVWQLADWEKCTQRTILNRIDVSVRAILREFGGMKVEQPPLVNEHGLERYYQPHFRSEKLTGGERVQLERVFITGVGFMLGPKRLRDGSEKAEARKLYANRPR